MQKKPIIFLTPKATTALLAFIATEISYKKAEGNYVYYSDLIASEERSLYNKTSLAEAGLVNAYIDEARGYPKNHIRENVASAEEEVKRAYLKIAKTIGIEGQEEQETAALEAFGKLKTFLNNQINTFITNYPQKGGRGER